jgi:hypothetical protein
VAAHERPYLDDLVYFFIIHPQSVHLSNVFLSLMFHFIIVLKLFCSCVVVVL